MNSSIHLIGLNHRTAPVNVRERFALAAFCSPDAWAVPPGEGISESLILSTCNRVEILTVGEGDAPRLRALQCWTAASGHPAEELEPYLYQYRGADAVRHLFSVASSLDSMVLGEPQILGQLKAAYRKSTESHAAGTIINRLLHKAFSVAKRVRSETGVASSAVSISYAAVELARRIFDDMDHHDALIIGAGEMAELAAMHLKQAGIRRLLVSNRTFSRAEDLAASLGGTAVPFDSLMEKLAECDIVISSTGAPGIIISGQDMRGVLKKRRHRPMFLIDIAMPRDIDPAVNQLDNIYLYDIDDLKEVVEENLAGRREEAVKAWSIVEEETQSFMQWMDSLALQPVIVALGERGRRIMEEELAKTLRRLGPVDDATREALEVMADSLVRRFNHEPIAFLKDRFHEARDPAYTLQAVDTIKRVFKLD